MVYLDNFANEIQDTLVTNLGFPQADRPTIDNMRWRAEMYGQSITQAYWRGENNEKPPLPAYPGDGTTLCMTRCRCEWVWTMEDYENGDFDVVWSKKPEENCSTCLERAQLWNPLQIRNWVIQA